MLPKTSAVSGAGQDFTGWTNDLHRVIGVVAGTFAFGPAGPASLTRVGGFAQPFVRRSWMRVVMLRPHTWGERSRHPAQEWGAGGCDRLRSLGGQV
jgi:hypothetical protein